MRDEVRRIEAAGGEAIVAGAWGVPPASERYSFQFDGRLQTLDHMLLTDGLRPRLAAFRWLLRGDPG